MLCPLLLFLPLSLVKLVNLHRWVVGDGWVKREGTEGDTTGLRSTYVSVGGSFIVLSPNVCQIGFSVPLQKVP